MPWDTLLGMNQNFYKMPQCAAHLCYEMHQALLFWKWAASLKEYFISSFFFYSWVLMRVNLKFRLFFYRIDLSNQKKRCLYSITCYYQSWSSLYDSSHPCKVKCNYWFEQGTLPSGVLCPANISLFPFRQFLFEFFFSGYSNSFTFLSLDKDLGFTHHFFNTKKKFFI